MRQSRESRVSDQQRPQYEHRDDHRYPPPNYDSHYDEGEDIVGFVNIIDMDIPFFQLVWLIFKVFLAAIVAASIIAVLGMLLSWILTQPVVQDFLPGDSSWLTNLIKPNG